MIAFTHQGKRPSPGVSPAKNTAPAHTLQHRGLTQTGEHLESPYQAATSPDLQTCTTQLVHCSGNQCIALTEYKDHISVSASKATHMPCNAGQPSEQKGVGAQIGAAELAALAPAVKGGRRTLQHGTWPPMATSLTLWRSSGRKGMTPSGSATGRWARWARMWTL